MIKKHFSLFILLFFSSLCSANPLTDKMLSYKDSNGNFIVSATFISSDEMTVHTQCQDYLFSYSIDNNQLFLKTKDIKINGSFCKEDPVVSVLIEHALSSLQFNDSFVINNNTVSFTSLKNETVVFNLL